MPKNFGEIVDADLTPDDPEHSRRILDPWLIRTVSVDSAEWKDVRDRELQRHRGKLRRRKIKSFFKLAKPPEGFRTLDRVKSSYEGIWERHSWNTPASKPDETSATLAEWNGQGLYLKVGGVNQMSLERLMALVALIEPKTVLEVGFGSGINLLTLSTVFPETKFTGIELSQSGLARAMSVQKEAELPTIISSFSPLPPRDLTAHRRIDFRNGNAADMPFADGAFDLVYSRLAIEQMELIRDEVLAEVSRVSSQGVALIEPFADFNQTEHLKLATQAKNHFSGFVADLEGYSMSPRAKFFGWPQRINQGIGLVFVTV